MDDIHLQYFYFISFVITFVLPVLLINNTIGKEIIKLKWENEFNIKAKLLIKYFIYYLAFVPSFSILSAITSFPALNPLFNLDSITESLFLFAFILTDLITFIIGLGKNHILDYLFKTNLHKYDFTRNPSKFLIYVYLFFGIFFLFSLYVYKRGFTVSSIETTLVSVLKKEQFPTDLYYGNHVFTISMKSNGVFKPTEPSSFIFNQKLRQKTLSLYLPKDAFNSDTERKSICLDLLKQSITNDMFSMEMPQQTRIILSNIERGLFLEFYHYFYIYYFDNDLIGWNIYGGIEVDSNTMHDYLNFNYRNNNYLINKMESIENKYNLSWEKIIEQSGHNEELDNEISSVLKSAFKAEIYYDKVILFLDTNKLELSKIDFKDTKLNGYLGINFPISYLEKSSNFIQVVNGEIMERDENVNYLKLLREETTNKGI